MDYKKMWENLKYFMEQALEEGVQCGYDKEKRTYENGAFYAYTRTFEEMNRLEGM